MPTDRFVKVAERKIANGWGGRRGDPREVRMADGIDLNYSKEKGSLAKVLGVGYGKSGPERMVTSVSVCASRCRVADVDAR